MSNPSADWAVTLDIVFPNHANPLGTLFGGRVLELMDINASIACQRFCRHAVVTASTEAVDFRNPIHVGEIIELKSRVAWTGRTSMIVRCEVHGENPLSGERRLCTIGHLNFVAIGADGKPTGVLRSRWKPSWSATISGSPKPCARLCCCGAAPRRTSPRARLSKPLQTSSPTHSSLSQHLSG